jgi:multidrug efflux system membrane fusion protein
MRLTTETSWPPSFLPCVALSLASILFFTGCSGGNAVQVKKSGVEDAVPVTISYVVEKPMPVELRAIGNVEAYSTVVAKAQIGGELMRVFFTEGQDVKKGDPLFQIDPRPYEGPLQGAEAALARDMAQEKQAEANLGRDIAQAEYAKTQAARYAKLAAQGVVSKEQADQMSSNAGALEEGTRADRAAIDSARAAVNADKAAVENAKLNLSYCLINSPINGRTGNLLIHQGNIVKATDVNLITINQVQPIYVDFNVPGVNLAEIKRSMAAGKLKVEAIPKDGGKPVFGVLNFVDNNIDTTTGTILLKGTFANEDRKLWPGEFLDVVLTLRTRPNAVVAPSQAIQTGQQGQFVFAVNTDQRVESRPVKIAWRVGDEVVIESGLKPGERVVTDGQLRLVPGSRVKEVKPSQGMPS